MRFRSEWLTLFTLTAIAVGAVSLPRGMALPPGGEAVAIAPAKRAELTAAGVDFMPIGTARAVGRARALRARTLPDHP
jgi:hypothetical protein